MVENALQVCFLAMTIFVHPLTLKFSDPDFERKYNKKHVRTSSFVWEKWSMAVDVCFLIVFAYNRPKETLRFLLDRPLDLLFGVGIAFGHVAVVTLGKRFSTASGFSSKLLMLILRVFSATTMVCEAILSSGATSKRSIWFNHHILLIIGFAMHLPNMELQSSFSHCCLAMAFSFFRFYSSCDAALESLTARDSILKAINVTNRALMTVIGNVQFPWNVEEVLSNDQLSQMCGHLMFLVTFIFSFLIPTSILRILELKSRSTFIEEQVRQGKLKLEDWQFEGTADGCCSFGKSTFDNGSSQNGCFSVLMVYSMAAYWALFAAL